MSETAPETAPETPTPATESPATAPAAGDADAAPAADVTVTVSDAAADGDAVTVVPEAEPDLPTGGTTAPSTTSPASEPDSIASDAPAVPDPADVPPTHHVRLGDVLAMAENFFARHPELDRALHTDLASGLRALERRYFA